LREPESKTYQQQNHQKSSNLLHNHFIFSFLIIKQLKKSIGTFLQEELNKKKQ
jgi:hypothetical protein